MKHTESRSSNTILVLKSLQIIGDISYAWGDIIDNFTPHMQQGVKKDPKRNPKLWAPVPFWRSLFEPVSKGPPGTLQGECPRHQNGAPNWTIFDATTRHKVGESPAL